MEKENMSMGGRKMLYLLVLSVLLISLSSTFVSAEVTDQLKGEGSQSRLTTTSAEECISSSSSTSTVDVITNICYVVVTGTSTVTETTFANYEKVNGKWQGEGRFIQDTLNEEFYSYEDYSLVPSRETCRTIRSQEDTCVDGSCMKCTKTIGYPAGCASHLERAEECYPIGSSSFINPVTRLSSHSSYSTNSQQSCSGDVSITTRTGSYSETDNSCYTNHAGNSQCGPVRYYSTSAQVTEWVCSVDKCTEGFDLCGTCGGDVTEITWSGPSVGDVSCGLPVIQINSCGEVRTLEGTKDCCTDTSWGPDSSEVCYEDRFYQTSNCGTPRLAFGTLLDETYCTIPPSTITPACGDVSRTYDTTELFFNSSTYCDSGIVSEIPSYPTTGNSVSWDCIGTDSTISCSASRLACEDGFAWNVTSNSCEETSFLDDNSPTFVPITCQASSSIDPDGTSVYYDLSWYEVQENGSLSLVTKDPLLNVTRFALENTIYVCEVYAIDEDGGKSHPEWHVATLKKDSTYIPFGVLDVNTIELGDYVGEENIPLIVEVDDAFEYVVQASCLYGECINVQTLFLYDASYLSSLRGDKLVFPYFSASRYTSATTLLPDSRLDFVTPLSSQFSGTHSDAAYTNAYEISQGINNNDALDYVRHVVTTIVLLEDGSFFSTANRTVFLPQNTVSFEIGSDLHIQDRLRLTDPVSIALDSYQDNTIIKGPVDNFPDGSTNQFYMNASGVGQVQTKLDSTGMSSYLNSITSSLSPVDTYYVYGGLCSEVELVVYPSPISLENFNSDSVINLEVYTKYFSTGNPVPVSNFSNLAITFNTTALQNYFGDNYSTFISQVNLEKSTVNCDVSDTESSCISGTFSASTGFNQEIFDALMNISDTSRIIKDSIIFTYTDTTCDNSISTSVDFVKKNHPPVPKILSPYDRYPYYVNSIVNFNSSVIDPDGDSYNLTWTIVKDGYTSTLANFTYNFTEPGQTDIVLRAEDQYGWAEDRVSILLSASPAMLAYIDDPYYNEVISGTNGVVTVNGSGSYVINSSVPAGCVNPVVTCLAGACPPTTGNKPAECSAPNLTIISGPQPLTDVFFNWTFDDGDEKAGLGLAISPKQYVTKGQKSVMLSLEYNKGGIDISSTSSLRPFTIIDEICIYESTPKSRSHYSTLNGNQFGSVNLTKKCNGVVTQVETGISFNSSNKSVATDNADGRYVVKSQGSSTLSIYHNGLYTGLDIDVYGICGIEDITVPESFFNKSYGMGEIIELTNISVIKNTETGCPNNICNANIANLTDDLFLGEKVPYNNLTFSEVKNQYEVITVNYCDMNNKDAGVRISFNATKNFFCVDVIDRDYTVLINETSERLSSCEKISSSREFFKDHLIKLAVEDDLDRFDFVFLRDDNSGEENSLINYLSHGIATVLQKDAFNDEIKNRQRLDKDLNHSTLSKNPDFNYVPSLTEVEYYRACSEVLSVLYETYYPGDDGESEYYGSDDDFLGINSDKYSALQDWIDFCVVGVTFFLEDTVTKTFSSDGLGSQLKLCAVDLNDEDRACCPSINHCVYDGTCYAPDTVFDVDGDGSLEMCEGISST